MPDSVRDRYNRDIDTSIVNIKHLSILQMNCKSRGHLARRDLVRLFNKTNKQVRLQAAKFVYPVARPEAKKCLQDLAAGPFPTQVFSARMTLHRLEEVPDCLDH